MAQNALQALERLIDYNIQSKRADVQESLAFMQFGMQKRAAEVKEFGIQMEVLGNANKQLQLNVANNFIKNSGLQSILNIIPTGIKDSEEAQDELSSVVNTLRKNKIGGIKAKFNDANANDIASALWEYKNTQDPSSVVNLANKVESMYQPGYKGTTSDKNLLDAFNKISNLSMLRQVGKQAKQSLQNESDILKEQFEFARGDTKIQSGFGMFSKDVAREFQSQKNKELESEDDILKLADEFESEEDFKSDELEYKVFSDTDEQLKKYNNLNESIKEDRDELLKLRNLKRKGFEVDNERIKNLSKDIDDSKKEKNSMSGLMKRIAYEEDIKRNVEEIENLAIKILEDNELEATESNLNIAKARAADVIRDIPALQFEQSPTSLGHQRPAYDTYGRIKR